MSGARYEVKSCNILRNTDTISNRGTFYIDGNTLIEDSCILENKAYYIFRFDSSSYSVTLSNCTIDTTSSNGNVVMTKTVTKSFILALNHISTRNCYSEYDSAGTLTAIPNVSLSTNKILCYTCKVNHNNARIREFFSVNNLFMIAFIHSDPSEYY
jgi:hypothetical protein